MNWNDINLRKFKKINTLNRQEITEDTIFEYVAIIEDKTLDEALDMTLSQMRAKIQELQGLKKRPRKTLVKGHYTLNGTKYILNHKPDSITTAQYIDYQSFASDPDNNIERILSIFLIPEGYKYNKGYDIEQVQGDIMDYMGVEDALSVMDFFQYKFRLLLKCQVRRLKRILRQAEKSKVLTQEERKSVEDKVHILGSLLSMR